MTEPVGRSVALSPADLDAVLHALADAIRTSTPDEQARLRDLVNGGVDEGALASVVSEAVYAPPPASDRPRVVEIKPPSADLGLQAVPPTVTIVPGATARASAGELSITAVEAASKSVGAALSKALAAVEGRVPGLTAALLVLALERACPPAQAPTTVNNVTQNISVVVNEPVLSPLARVVLNVFRDSGATTTTVGTLAASTSLSPADVELALRQLVAAGVVVELAPAPGVYGLR